MNVRAEKRKRVTGVWRRVRVCDEPLLVTLVLVVEEAGSGGVHCFMDGDEGVVAPEGIGRAFRNTQFLVPISIPFNLLRSIQ